MKKAYFFILCIVGLLTACTKGSNDTQVFQTIASANPEATLKPHVFSTKVGENYSNTDDIALPNCKFIINRCILRDPGANITVDAALSFLISTLNLPVSYDHAYKFLGYDTLEDGTCYVYAYGTYRRNTFKETVRFAVSYNKTIYQSKLKNGKLSPFKEAYGLDTGLTQHKNSITAVISNGKLKIKEKRRKKKHVFHLEDYGLESATTEDIVIMDMNFDGYLDVAVRANKPDGTYRFHAFLYQKMQKGFAYINAYSNLVSPSYDAHAQTISCSSISEEQLVYDTYQIVNNQPEIQERTSYTYLKEDKVWRMDYYTGQNGDLLLIETTTYTTYQVSKQTGELLKDN